MSPQFSTLTYEECTKLLGWILNPKNKSQQPRIYTRNYCMTLLMLDAGLRVGEVVQLRQNQLYFAGGPVGAITVSPYQAKNKCGRVVPVTIMLHAAIDTMQRHWWIHESDDPYNYAFYTCSPVLPLGVRQVQRIIRHASRYAIGREIHPHLLRHTFATRLMKKTSLRVVQQLLGHKSIQSTQVYTHPNSEDYQEAIDALNSSEHI